MILNFFCYYSFKHRIVQNKRFTKKNVFDGRKSGETIFTGGANKRHNSGKIVSARFGAKTTGDFLFGFEEAKISFTLLF